MGSNHETVSVLGVGAIGSAVATTMLAAGRPTTVWNRTTTRADPLVDAGASRASVDLDLFADTVSAQLGHVPRAASDVVGEVRAGEFPAGPASLAEHLPVIRQLLDVREHARLGDGGLDAVAARVEREIAAGHQEHGLASLVG